MQALVTRRAKAPASPHGSSGDEASSPRAGDSDALLHKGGASSSPALSGTASGAEGGGAAAGRRGGGWLHWTLYLLAALVGLALLLRTADRPDLTHKSFVEVQGTQVRACGGGAARRRRHLPPLARPHPAGRRVPACLPLLRCPAAPAAPAPTRLIAPAATRPQFTVDCRPFYATGFNLENIGLAPMAKIARKLAGEQGWVPQPACACWLRSLASPPPGCAACWGITEARVWR